jgi:GalNAc5-diNAcBac-PP-undecaprenol beta-1,3-glucosyltransferase
MTYQPKYTVIIPTHKRAGLLKRALSSLKEQANASQLEVIVVSDCGDTDTDQVCQQLLSPSDIYVRRAGLPGPSASRNIGLQMAKGQFILFLDDDDAWHNNLIDALNACDHLQNGHAIYFDGTVIKESRTDKGPVFLREIFISTSKKLNENVFVKNQIHMSCFAFPRHLLGNLAFDLHMRAYEDWDFLLYVFEREMPVHFPIIGSKIYEVDDETTDRRGNSKQAHDYNAILDYLYVYRRHPTNTILQEKRRTLLNHAGLPLPSHTL